MKLNFQKNFNLEINLFIALEKNLFIYSDLTCDDITHVCLFLDTDTEWLSPAQNILEGK